MEAHRRARPTRMPFITKNRDAGISMPSVSRAHGIQPVTNSSVACSPHDSATTQRVHSRVGFLSPAIQVLWTALPDLGYQTFGPRHVGHVFVTKRIDHHLLFGADTTREQDPESNEIRRPRHPVRHGEGLTDRVEEERRVHRMPNPAVDAL